MRTILIALGLAATSAAAWGQTSSDDLVKLGTLATLAPLCGQRSQAWGFDLRRAELQSATHSRRFDDEALRAAPGSEQATAALSYAETEALENFAGVSPLRTCGELTVNPDMDRADEIVRAFRAQRGPAAGS